MSPTPRRSHPNPSPKGVIAGRLEHIRELHGIGTLKDFHQVVQAAARPGEPVPSYAAVRTYHFDRDPPVSYLVLVARAFGVSLRYLAEGEDAPTPLADQAREREALRDQYRAAAYGPPEVIEEDREELRRRFGVNPFLYILLGVPPSAVNDLQELAYRGRRSLGGLASELFVEAVAWAMKEAEGGDA